MDVNQRIMIISCFSTLVIFLITEDGLNCGSPRSSQANTEGYILHLREVHAVGNQPMRLGDLTGIFGHKINGQQGTHFILINNYLMKLQNAHH